MRTSKEYLQNCKNNIITTTMLEDALLSVNKRAKNWRDKCREIRQQRWFGYQDAAINNAEVEKEKIL